MHRSKMTVPRILASKGRTEPMTMVTAYDFTSARLADRAGVDMILVGDSASMVMLGNPSTVQVSLEDMLLFTRAASRGAQRALIVGDLPFLSYGVSLSASVESAGRMIKEGGAQAVKLEGGREMCEHVSRIVQCKIPVMGHLGLTPQAIHQMGGHRVQAKSIQQAKKLLEDARCLVEAGVFAMVLEGIPAPVAKWVSQSIPVPTIGIGAGAACDGQVLVWQDLLGLDLSFAPRFLKRYARLEENIVEALQLFCEEVRSGKFPEDAHSYPVEDKELLEWLESSSEEESALESTESG